MDANKDINEWRAEKLGYVYFSRLNDLIINESNDSDKLFDYWIDIGENHKPTGRYFAVEVKSFNNKKKPAELVPDEYRNLAIPALLVLFDNSNDRGYYTWIKKPEKNGELVFYLTKAAMADLNNDSLNRIVTEIKDWYSRKQIA
jgi:hypothetical protein